MTFDEFKPNIQREHKPAPEELKLAGGEPAINLFLDNKPVISHEEHESASEKLRTVAEAFPEEFKALEGKPVDEAREEAARLYGMLNINRAA